VVAHQGAATAQCPIEVLSESTCAPVLVVDVQGALEVQFVINNPRPPGLSDQNAILAVSQVVILPSVAQAVDIWAMRFPIEMLVHH
jgi:hypothetical protein